jgi:hypothetical protein
MFNFFSKSNAVAEDSNPKLAGPGFIVLNILRVCNIIVLLTIAIGSWIMLVKTVQNSNVSSPLHSIWINLLTALVLFLRRCIPLHHFLGQRVLNCIRVVNIQDIF